MDCQTFDSSLLDALYDELDASTSAAMEEHASTCEACSSQAARLRKTHKLIQDELVVQPSEDLEVRILAAAEAEMNRAAGIVIPLPEKSSRASSADVMPSQSPSHAPAESNVRPIAPAQEGGGAKIYSFFARPQFAIAAAFVLVLGATAIFLNTTSEKRAASAAAGAANDEPASAASASTMTPPTATATTVVAMQEPPPVDMVPAPTQGLGFNAVGESAPAASMAYAPAVAAAAPPPAPTPTMMARHAPPPPRSAPMKVATGEDDATPTPKPKAKPNDYDGDEGRVAKPGKAGGNGSGAGGLSGLGSGALQPSTEAAKEKDSHASSTAAFDAAKALYNQGRYAEALPKFEALAAHDANAELYVARCLAHTRGCAAAAPRYDNAARRNPANESIARSEAATCESKNAQHKADKPAATGTSAPANTTLK